MNRTRGLLASAVALGVAAFLATALPVGAAEPYQQGGSSYYPSTGMAPVEQGTLEKVNLNTAGVDELARVEGIGEGLAHAIVSYRSENGPFSSVDDLLKVKGISQTELTAFRDRVTVE